LAPVTSRFHRGVVVKRPPIETNFYEVPKLAPFRTIFLSELDVTNIGNVVAREGGATDVFADLLADDTIELAHCCMRRTELFASQILNYGKVRYRLDGGEYEEFGYGSGVPTEFDPALPWDDPSALIIDDLVTVSDQIVADTGQPPNMLVMSPKVTKAFLANPQVKDQLDRLHLVTGSIRPDRPRGSAQYLGSLYLPSLEMWSYSEKYIDEFDGVSLAPMIPDYRAIVGTTDPSGFQYWGSIIQMEESGFTESAQMKLIPRLDYDTHNEIAQYRLQSRPCLVPLDVASWTMVNALAPPPPPPRNASNHTPSIPTEGVEPEPKTLKKGVK
jgi:hypothetical protein